MDVCYRFDWIGCAFRSVGKPLLQAVHGLVTGAGIGHCRAGWLDFRRLIARALCAALPKRQAWQTRRPAGTQTIPHALSDCAARTHTAMPARPHSPALSHLPRLCATVFAGFAKRSRLAGSLARSKWLLALFLHRCRQCRPHLPKRSTTTRNQAQVGLAERFGFGHGRWLWRLRSVFCAGGFLRFAVFNAQRHDVGAKYQTHCPPQA